MFVTPIISHNLVRQQSNNYLDKITERFIKGDFMSLVSIKRALISVSDKTNLVEFANELKAAGVEILSTGGTAKLLSEAGIPVVKINDYTGFPEIMGGRVKTLHPKVHGGLLGRLGTDEAVMQAQDIPTIDLLVVNLYPFSQTIAKVDCSYEDAIENIDIGGNATSRSEKS